MKPKEARRFVRQLQNKHDLDFDLTANPIVLCDVQNFLSNTSESREIFDSYHDLHEANMFRLPHESVNVVHVLEDLNAHYRICSYMRQFDEHIHVVHVSDSNYYQATMCHKDHRIDFFKCPKEYDEQQRDLLRVLNTVVGMSITLMNTRGIRKDVYHTKTKSKKLKARDSAADSVTIIRVCEHLTTDTNAHSASERHRPRLHIRRGHFRDQRVGKARCEVKRVWIEPCLVGHEEDGFIDHDYVV